ncbi:hypothetical protein EWB00_003246 [Schistosoma japonicum]|uniref:Uncharacterized protein n=1 Tax=Schistosoma japonicum TaxID=6182 RepID=A0A4Z2D9H0_SCHJA|nr:hypothetical protein EWB00_003246 [Schistosoma japonicum]
MMLSVFILMTVLSLMMKIDNSISANCYTCNPCPTPFSPSSYLVRNKTGCRYCAKIRPDGYPIVVRDCTDTCEFSTWSYMFSKYSYNCCTGNFCNKSQTNYPTHQMVILLLFTIYLFVNKTSTKI